MKSSQVLGIVATGSLLFGACSDGFTTDSAAQNETSSLTTEVVANPSTDVLSTEATGDATASDDATTEGNAAAAPSVLQFSAPLVGGGDLDATTLAGKPTVFWFWAPT